MDFLNTQFQISYIKETPPENLRLMNYIKKHDFKAFGWYRIILGIVVLLYFLIFM